MFLQEKKPTRGTNQRGHLKIQGTVYQGTTKVQDGIVLITVIASEVLQQQSPSFPTFQQSISVPLIGGAFGSDDPSFRPVRPNSAIEVRAEITTKEGTERAVIHLNSEPSGDKSALEYSLIAACLVLAVVFFLAFTGRKTTWKNQTAIIFSYVVIALFLAVPLLAPVLLINSFPNAIQDMIGAPAGLVNTHTANQDKCETQWALNIGGYSYIPENKCTDKNLAKPTGPGTPTGATNATDASANAAAMNQNPSQAPIATSDISGSTNPTASPQPSPTPNGGGHNPTVVEVQGGLVIPLYVIILSVIGGAINMTRKVPGFQKEGEESDFSLGRPISSLGSRVMRFLLPSQSKTEVAALASTSTGVPPPEQEKKAGTLDDQANEVEKELGPLLLEQIERSRESDKSLAAIRGLVGKMQELFRARTTDDPLLKFNSFEDWAASHPKLGELLRGSWRVELLNQYMYLISAPFLAVVTYYILDLLGLSKQGVVVVLSFSVGLISEKIVSWILGIATGYLRTDEKKT